MPRASYPRASRRRAVDEAARRRRPSGERLGEPQLAAHSYTASSRFEVVSSGRRAEVVRVAPHGRPRRSAPSGRVFSASEAPGGPPDRRTRGSPASGAARLRSRRSREDRAIRRVPSARPRGGSRPAPARRIKQLLGAVAPQPPSSPSRRAGTPSRRAIRHLVRAATSPRACARPARPARSSSRPEHDHRSAGARRHRSAAPPPDAPRMASTQASRVAAIAGASDSGSEPSTRYGVSRSSRSRSTSSSAECARAASGVIL